MKAAPRKKMGHVFLVGAGPGDPGLLTLRAAELLAEADVVLYDRLVNPEILKHAKNATLVPVGKKPGRPGTLRQDRIHRLLIRYARAGFRTVRLKGGDPFVFGRGGEEQAALAAAGVPCTVTPGVSSFYSAPAAAGIPVTHRGLSTGFAVFTAHEAMHGSSGTPWEALAQIPTLVFLMGVESLPEIVRRLLAAGRDADTPAAVISRGTLPDQAVVIATLGTIAERARDLRAPATIVVGAVAELGLAHAQLDEEELEAALRGEFLRGA